MGSDLPISAGDIGSQRAKKPRDGALRQVALSLIPKLASFASLAEWQSYLRMINTCYAGQQRDFTV